MAFGVKRNELKKWKQKVEAGEIAFLTHYWLDDRFPESKTVTKVGCSDKVKLAKWGKQYDLKPQWIHNDPHYPHFDLLGKKQLNILKAENMYEHINRFHLED
ncbi:hypothetical protein [Pontibacillus yanchengensis]|uniref:YneQ n=1 Tax=Pontibacillus yanchengensis Y32 TaxID=1385514 RepID=A0A0A2TW14_9BACI|nr:hypothetical protein [Pontibacillus yanchengensis]KGP73480.1 hypothetical protein N782_04450 [Pontibacillus yanchengensis Y32]